MTHIDDWLDDPSTGPAEVKEWLEHRRRPAVYQKSAWLNQRKVTCMFKGSRWRCTGASRMGDVWLASNLERESGYDERVDIAECTDWKLEMNTELTPATMKIGGHYNWKNQPDRLVYLGHNWAGNGFWHQFKKIGDDREVWCEVLTSELRMLEETKE